MSELKLKYAEVQHYDPKFELAEDMRKTLFMKIIHREYARIMREQYGKHDTFDALEHQLFTEIATRQREEEHYGKGKGLRSAEQPYGDFEYIPDGYAYWDPWLGALAPKRDREDGDENEDDARNVMPREDKGSSNGKGKKGARGPLGPRMAGSC